MADISIDTHKMRQYADRIGAVHTRAQRLEGRVDYLSRKASSAELRRVAYANYFKTQANKLNRCKSYLNNAADDFEKLEKELCNYNPTDFRRNIAKEFWAQYGFGGLLSGSGYLKDFMGITKDLTKAKTLYDVMKSLKKAEEKTVSLIDMYGKYKKIGRAIGAKKSRVNFVKKALGITKYKYVSKANNTTTKFWNNLVKNKTSPFNIKNVFKEAKDTFTGAKGVGKAVCAWAGVVFDGVTNYFDNKAEQAQSGGKMSDGRVVAETITETAVGTVLSYASGAIVGAAVAAIAPAAAAPLAIAAIGTAVTIGANMAVKELTGKSATELISDGILDTGIKIGKFAKKASKVISKYAYIT